MTGRQVLPAPVAGSDGLPLLGPLRTALSGSGPALAPHACDRPVDPAALLPLTADEDDDGDPVAAVVSTTGSTGRPKHVLLTASALLASAAATHDALGGAGTWLLAVPAHTVAGVQVLIRSLVAGTRPAVLDLSGGFDPVGFAAAADAMAAAARGRRYTSLVPAQLDLLLEAGREHQRVIQALRGVDTVLVGGAALPLSVRGRAEHAGVRVVSTYGMTETCGGCVYDGVPLPGVQIRLGPDEGGGSTDGSDGRDGRDGAPGRVVVVGPVVARGYRTAGAPSPSTGFGEGFAVVDGRRAFRTADRGLLVEGRLELVGRIDDVVTSGGVNVALGAVDRVLRAQPGVRDCLVVAVPSERWGSQVGALVVDAATGAADDLRLRTAVRDALGGAAVPRLLRHLDRLPLTGVGKPDRAEAVRLLTPVHAPGPRLGDHGGPDDPSEETT